MITDTIAREVIVTGNVQGVFFRAGMRREARRLGVTGWASNRHDGRVEAHVEGSRDAVERLVLWCRSGPTAATVHHVRATKVEPAGYVRFAIR